MKAGRWRWVMREGDNGVMGWGHKESGNGRGVMGGADECGAAGGRWKGNGGEGCDGGSG